MITKRTALAGGALGLALIVGSGERAAAYEFTGTFPGGNCAAMAQKIPPSKLWYGHFTGQRQVGIYEFLQTRTVDGCFTTKAQCDNWLYQWRSEFQYNFWNDYCIRSNQRPPRRPYAG